ncbi:MAG: glycosyltransferase [Bacteroidetes bacterium]|jgi:teichuronic acid biosynthesis glycosyltransferase TuaH|nr:glycosyltransferase [Bacteroidota bacterium]MBT4730193.1 glycosyltransferase [Bacteroidota bacterium]MBT7996597.1 glycosyltransferase [Bacteroidota bacterium]
MIKGKDIIVTGIIHWEIEIGSNCQDIAKEFSKNNRVLYVYHPLNHATWLKSKDPKVKDRLKKSRSKERGLVKKNENLYILYTKRIIFSINWLPSGKLFNWMNRINALIFASDITKTIRKLNFETDILFNDTSMFLGLHLKELLNPKIYAYYIRDNMIKVDYWARHGTKAEPELLNQVDLITNNSLYYTEYGKMYNKHSYMVGQGCDVSSFDESKHKLTIPEDINKITKPIIGYIGNISTLRLEISLISYIAQTHPEWSIVLVGPEDDDFKLSKLHNMDNLYFLGNKDMSLIPNYVKALDVAINPQLVNDLTIGNYPRKIDEYLALGKAVVATSTKAMEYFKDVCYLAENKEEFVRLIELALAEESKEKKEKRREVGLHHSWETNVNEIYKAIENVALEKGINI